MGRPSDDDNDAPDRLERGDAYTRASEASTVVRVSRVPHMAFR